MCPKTASNISIVRDIFLQEVERRLPDALAALQQIQSDDLTLCGELYRFTHTLKGSGAMAGLPEIADPATDMTVALKLVQDYAVPLAPGIKNFLSERMEEIIQEVNERLEAQHHLSPVMPSFRNQGKSVLIIDDDPTVTWLVKERLERVGLSVTVCGDTASAEQVLAGKSLDLIVLDILLPGENGIQFCRKIRSDTYRQLIPIIFLTVRGRLQDKIEGFTSGADDYLAKPFDVEELVVRIQAIIHRMETVQDWAWQDELTGIYNRRYLQRRLEEEVSRAERNSTPLSVAMLDIDLFKNVNDQYGHLVGDEGLRQVAQRIARTLRVHDVVCRYGGEEFVIILPDTAQEQAGKVVERVRKTFADQPLTLEQAGMKLPLTISAGVAGFPQDAADAAALLAAADTAMYQAKREGRNRVVAARGVSPCS